jgi:tRNA(Ile)-lysidine synthase
MDRPRLAVATSGGLDSTALLHCTLAQARALGADVVALHVHHGLLPEADAWRVQVQRQALRWGAAFDSRQLGGAPARGESVEAWAREGRYAALADMAHAQGCGLVLLAHHRRDQAETWLLQALRGAGDAGLSAMPARVERRGLVWARPWLDQGRGAIEAYARRHRLKWVEDPSNADPRFARSRLRRAVWPALHAAFPDAETTLAQAARHAQFSAALARETAVDDLGDLAQARGLHRQPWLDLPPARRRNALRWWLMEPLGSFPPHSLVDRLMLELPAMRSGSWPTPAGWLRLNRGWLAHEPAAVAMPAVAPDRSVDLSQPGRLQLPEWGGDLVVTRCQSGGVPASKLRQVCIHARRGGEQFSLAPKATARSLKKQFQALGLPAWARQGPLVSGAQGELLFVPRLGMDARSWAEPGAQQFQLQWEPAALVKTVPGQLPG